MSHTLVLVFYFGVPHVLLHVFPRHLYISFLQGDVTSNARSIDVVHIITG